MKCKYASKDSAGLDLLAKEEVTIKAHSSGVVNVGKFDLSNHTHLAKQFLGTINVVGLILPKSGLNFKHDIVERVGVIDELYKGDVMCKLDNHSDVDFTFKVGDPVAQMVVVPFVHLNGYDVEDVER